MNWNEFLNEIISFILQPKLPDWFLPVKYTFIFFTFFFLGYVVWSLVKTTWLKRFLLWDLKEFLTYRPFYSKTFAPKWKKIEKRLETGIESDFKLAVLEADELLNECLTKMGYPGEKLEEKLEKLTEEVISNLEEVKKIREVRNSIIEDPTFKLTLEETKRVLAVYKKALEDLQAL